MYMLLTGDLMLFIFILEIQKIMEIIKKYIEKLDLISINGSDHLSFLLVFYCIFQPFSYLFMKKGADFFFETVWVLARYLNSMFLSNQS